MKLVVKSPIMKHSLAFSLVDIAHHSRKLCFGIFDDTAEKAISKHNFVICINPCSQVRVESEHEKFSAVIQEYHHIKYCYK